MDQSAKKKESLWREWDYKNCPVQLGNFDRTSYHVHWPYFYIRFICNFNKYF